MILQGLLKRFAWSAGKWCRW